MPSAISSPPCSTTALHIAYVAQGSYVAGIASTPKLWDITAGAIICECAGAVMTDWQGKDIFPFDPANYEGQEFQTISANKKVHGQIVDLINS